RPRRSPRSSTRRGTRHRPRSRGTPRRGLRDGRGGAAGGPAGRPPHPVRRRVPARLPPPAGRQARVRADPVAAMRFRAAWRHGSVYAHCVRFGTFAALTLVRSLRSLLLERQRAAPYKSERSERTKGRRPYQRAKPVQKRAKRANTISGHRRRHKANTPPGDGLIQAKERGVLFILRASAYYYRFIPRLRRCVRVKERPASASLSKLLRGAPEPDATRMTAN